MKKLRSSAARRAGYTLVEVMFAVSVMLVGAAGFTALHGASARAVRQAQEFTIAAAFQETWAERVRRDALRWNAAGAAALSNTWYLSQATGAWYVPASQITGGGETAGADAWGHDTATNSDIRYCVNLRNNVAHLWNPAAGPTGAPPTAADVDAMRVDIRVWWYRTTLAQEGPFPVDIAGNGCATLPSDAQIASTRFNKVVSSTIVRWREAP